MLWNYWPPQKKLHFAHLRVPLSWKEIRIHLWKNIYPCLTLLSKNYSLIFNVSTCILLSMLLDLSNYQHHDDQGKITIPYKNFQPISSTRTLLSEIVKKVNLFYKKVANSYDKASFALCSKTVGRFVQSVTALLMAATMSVRTALSLCRPMREEHRLFWPIE